MLYVFILKSEFVFKQKLKFWNPLNVFVSLIRLLLNKSCENSEYFCFQVSVSLVYREYCCYLWHHYFYQGSYSNC